MAVLTDREIAALTATNGRQEHFDSQVSGLALRVGPSGVKSWVLLYRERVPDGHGGFVVGRRARRWTLGRYPAVKLAEARQKARKALDAMDLRGIDPADTKHQGRTGTTFKDLADAYIADYAKPKKRSWAEDQATINAELLKPWGSKPAKAVTRQDVRTLLRSIINRGAPVRADRVQSLVSRIYNFGIEEDIVEVNPAARIQKQHDGTSRTRTLSDEELRELWTVLDACQLPPSETAPPIPSMIALGLQVQILTAQRPGEVFQMRRQDIDGDWWTIPGQFTKNKKTHRVPLTRTAARCIQAAIKAGPADGAWVFSGVQRRIGPKGKPTQGRMVSIGNVSDRAKKAAAVLVAAEAVSFDFHRHDLRRTAATGMTRAGVPRASVSQVLNHADRGPRATMVYDQYEYDKEKRIALETWDRELRRILSEQPATGKVLPMSRR